MAEKQAILRRISRSARKYIENEHFFASRDFFKMPKIRFQIHSQNVSECNSELRSQNIFQNCVLKVTPNLRGATFTKIIFLDHIKVNYLNLHFPKNLT